MIDIASYDHKYPDIGYEDSYVLFLVYFLLLNMLVEFLKYFIRLEFTYFVRVANLRQGPNL